MPAPTCRSRTTANHRPSVRTSNVSSAGCLYGTIRPLPTRISCCLHSGLCERSDQLISALSIATFPPERIVPAKKLCRSGFAQWTKEQRHAPALVTEYQCHVSMKIIRSSHVNDESLS